MPDGDWRDDPVVWRIWGGLHRLLFRLGGLMPDDWLTHTRKMLATGDLAYLPDTISGSVAQVGVALTPAEVELLPYVLVALGVDVVPPTTLEMVQVSEVTPPTQHRFLPVAPALWERAGERIGTSLDLTGGASEILTDLPDDMAHLADLADDLTDMQDDVAVAVLRDDGVAGIWRAWRVGPEGEWRVYLAEVTPGVRAWELTHDAQEALKRHGERYPPVEVYWSGDQLTPYHEAARAGSALLWARRPGRVRAAQVYDQVDQGGVGRFTPAHPRLVDPGRREALLARLSGGAVVPGTDRSDVDIVRPERGRVVPWAYRTDGQWVWSEAVAYYLAEYGLAPEPELSAHLLATATAPSTVDGVALFRARRAIAGMIR